jgi:hypothetical protein
MIRSFVAAVMLGLLFAATAQAKLNPTFSKRIAEPGDTVELDVGEGSELFMAPLRVFLVSLEGADRLQVKLGELGTPGKFDAPRILRFKVPDVPAGDYTVAIWFKGYETGTWNAVDGIDSLTINGGQSDRQTTSLLWAAITIGGLGAGLVACSGLHDHWKPNTGGRTTTTAAVQRAKTGR